MRMGLGTWQCQALAGSGGCPNLVGFGDGMDLPGFPLSTGRCWSWEGGRALPANVAVEESGRVA